MIDLHLFVFLLYLALCSASVVIEVNCSNFSKRAYTGLPDLNHPYSPSDVEGQAYTVHSTASNSNQGSFSHSLYHPSSSTKVNNNTVRRIELYISNPG